MADAVDHPRHYNAHKSGVECVEIAEHLGFNLGNAFKYVWRAGLKSEDPREDYKKALWYVRRWLSQTPARAGLHNGAQLALVRVLEHEREWPRREAMRAICSAARTGWLAEGEAASDALLLLTASTQERSDA